MLYFNSEILTERNIYTKLFAFKQPFSYEHVAKKEFLYANLVILWFTLLLLKHLNMYVLIIKVS